METMTGEKVLLGVSIGAREFGGSVTRMLPDGRLDHTQVWVLFDGVSFSQNFWREVPPDKADFWAAAGGRAFGLVCEERSCIATAEAMLHGLGFFNVYATWKLKSSSPSAWRTWQKKWSRRTMGDS